MMLSTLLIHQARRITPIRCLTTIAEEKLAAKQKRREMWDKRHVNADQRKARRRNRVRGVKRAQWESFFIPFSQDYNLLKDKVEWTIRVGAVVERLPIVTPDEPKWEEDYEELRDYLDAYGVDYPEGNPFLEPWSEDEDKQTFEELMKHLPEGLRPAPRETEADRTGYIHTLERALKQRVYLTVKVPSSSESEQFWDFPSSVLKEDETLLDAAKRAIVDAAGEDLVTYSIGNAPVAFNYRIFPNKEGDPLRGEKIFYFRITRDEGDVKNPMDCAWLTREEFVENSLKRFGDDSYESKLHHYHLST